MTIPKHFPTSGRKARKTMTDEERREQEERERQEREERERREREEQQFVRAAENAGWKFSEDDDDD